MAMTSEYKRKLAVGQAYEEFIVNNWLAFFPYPLNMHNGKYEQLKGENTEGVEIKLDQICKRTKRLYIEIEEKSNADNERMIQSGIQRNDNTVLFLIGDYEDAYIFDVLVLRKCFMDKPAWLKMFGNSTSNGWGMPLIMVPNYAICHLDFSNMYLEAYS